MPISFLEIFAGTTVGLLLLAGLLHASVRLASAEGWLARAVARAPGVDVLLFCFTALPQIIGPVLAGWSGLAAAVLGQVAALLAWIVAHELVHRGTTRRHPRIFRTLGRTVGGFRNHFGVWWTALAVPAFWVIRLAQVVVYTPLTWSVRLPAYRHADYVNLSRHKFDGLVGYDLIWCLYCDWMTGVWSLASEMLRNVESFWCPIRFADPTKCTNCRVDFPDVDDGWVPADGTMADVSALLERQYGRGVNAWYGHPARLTVGATDGEAARTNAPDEHLSR